MQPCVKFEPCRVVYSNGPNKKLGLIHLRKLPAAITSIHARALSHTINSAFSSSFAPQRISMAGVVKIVAFSFFFLFFFVSRYRWTVTTHDLQRNLSPPCNVAWILINDIIRCLTLSCLISHNIGNDESLTCINKNQWSTQHVSYRMTCCWLVFTTRSNRFVIHTQSEKNYTRIYFVNFIFMVLTCIFLIIYSKLTLENKE